MQARRITDELSVSPQISVADVAEIVAAGFRSIVCNRPDGEAGDQVAYGEIEAAAKAAGLEIVWQPIVTGRLSEVDGARFGEIVAGLPKPVFAYCRSGTRCTMLWSLSQAKERSSDEIVANAAQAGYDMAGLVPRLDAIKTTRVSK
jgi:sulfide:quinone oxidoreductase